MDPFSHPKYKQIISVRYSKPKFFSHLKPDNSKESKIYSGVKGTVQPNISSVYMLSCQQLIFLTYIFIGGGIVCYKWTAAVESVTPVGWCALQDILWGVCSDSYARKEEGPALHWNESSDRAGYGSGKNLRLTAYLGSSPNCWMECVELGTNSQNQPLSGCCGSFASRGG